MAELSIQKIHHDAIHAMGLFMLSWGMIEGTLEIAIAKELGLSPLKGSTVTAGMQFKARCSLLSSLLAVKKTENKAKIDLINVAQNHPTRNDIAHGVPGINEYGLIFYRRKTEDRFKSTLKTYSDNEMLVIATQIGNLAAQMQDAFGIDYDGYANYFQTAHKDSKSA